MILFDVNEEYIDGPKFLKNTGVNGCDFNVICYIRIKLILNPGSTKMFFDDNEAHINSTKFSRNLKRFQVPLT